MEPELTVAASRAPSALLVIAVQARGDALGAGVGAGAITTVGRAVGGTLALSSEELDLVGELVGRGDVSPGIGDFVGQ